MAHVLPQPRQSKPDIFFKKRKEDRLLNPRGNYIVLPGYCIRACRYFQPHKNHPDEYG